MRFLGAVALVGFGAIVALLGLLFLIGAAGQPSRYAIAGVGLILGGVTAGFGVRWFRHARARTADYIGAEIMALAEENNGEISADDVRALLGERFGLAAAVLVQMRDAGITKPREENGAVYYVFPHLQPRLLVRRCEFCEGSLPLDDDLATCPQCGGRIKTQVAQIGVSGEELYGLDE